MILFFFDNDSWWNQVAGFEQVVRQFHQVDRDQTQEIIDKVTTQTTSRMMKFLRIEHASSRQTIIHTIISSVESIPKFPWTWNIDMTWIGSEITFSSSPFATVSENDYVTL